MTTPLAQRIRTLQSTPPACSLYPLYPSNSEIRVRVSGSDFGTLDRLLVHGSSLLIVGSLLWVPPALVWCFRKWKQHSNRRLKALYGAFMVALLGLIAWGPHRHPAVGNLLRFRSWALWNAWLRFVSFEVLARKTPRNDSNSSPPPILAFCPHGIFPFAFGLGVLPEMAVKAFGLFRPVVATAIQAFPVVRTLVGWCGAVDASRSSVERVMRHQEAVGIIPGGIAEIFESYPKRGTHPDEEYAIVRKGFLKMALQYGRPVVPIYCFGSTKMFRQLRLPLLETLSNWLRVSLCLFYGAWGLPLPFRNRLLYVMGDAVHPPSTTTVGNDGADMNAQINELHKQFCNALQTLFEEHKEAYGWGHKSLKIISR